jgi:flagellar protein FlaG
MKPVENIGAMDIPPLPKPEGYSGPGRENASNQMTLEKTEKDPPKPDQVEQEKEAERQEVKRIAERLNRMGRVFDRRIQFEVPSDTKDVIVKVIDRETGQVIREIPPPDLTKLAAQMEAVHNFIFRSGI